MFGPRFHLFNLFGFPIYIDLSWFIIAVLVTWSLAEGLFRVEQWYPQLVDEPLTRWLMGVVGALGLFASIVLHELGHAKVAENYGVPMRGITLFIFGGVAEMSAEPPSARAEFMVAIAGPVVSVLIGALAIGGWALGHLLEAPVPVTAVLGYIGLINVLVVAFNMLPAFPLDGGRVLRSILWGARDNLRWATRITTQIGSGFGIALMVIAGLRLLIGDLVGAVWMFILGMFLRGAAQMSYQQLLVRRALEGEPVERFMTAEPITVRPEDTIDNVVENFIYRYHHKLYPVIDNDELVGCLTMDHVKEVDRDAWPTTRVGDVSERCGSSNTIELGRDAMDALSRMREQQRSRLMVVRGNELVGVVALKDLMDFLSLKVELEEPNMSGAVDDEGRI